MEDHDSCLVGKRWKKYDNRGAYSTEQGNIIELTSCSLLLLTFLFCKALTNAISEFTFQGLNDFTKRNI